MPAVGDDLDTDAVTADTVDGVIDGLDADADADADVTLPPEEEKEADVEVDDDIDATVPIIGDTGIDGIDESLE